MKVIIRKEKIQKLIHEYKNLVSRICLGISLVQRQHQSGEIKSHKALQVLIENSHSLRKSSIILTELIKIQLSMGNETLSQTSSLDDLTVADFIRMISPTEEFNLAEGQVIREPCTKISIFRILSTICCDEYSYVFKNRELTFTFHLNSPCELSSIDFLLIDMLVTDFNYDTTAFEILKENFFQFRIKSSHAKNSNFFSKHQDSV